MRTPGADSDSTAHAIDPHPPREPRAIQPPTPPPESPRSTLRSDVAIGRKDDGILADGNSAAAISMGQDRMLYLTPPSDEEAGQEALEERLPESQIGEDVGQNGLGIDNAFGASVDTGKPFDDTVDATTASTPESIALERGNKDDFSLSPISNMSDCRTINHGNCLTDAAQIIHRPHNESPNITIESNAEENTNGDTSPNLDDLSTSIDSAPMASMNPVSSSFEFSNRRLYPLYPSSFLRPGSKFSGTQQSDRQRYNVDVTVLTVSVPEASMTGYLRICGLTEDHPTLTTFFTGEIIGGPTHKHTFQTKDPSWGASDKTDLHHWARFPAWRQLSRAAKEDINFKYPPPATGLGSRSSHAGGAIYSEDAADHEYDSDSNPGWWTQPNVFMRWKEWFLVPDHRVRSIQGASFEGFYYICFNQAEGKINGIYFHAKSEK